MLFQGHQTQIQQPSVCVNKVLTIGLFCNCVMKNRVFFKSSLMEKYFEENFKASFFFLLVPKKINE